MSTRPEATQAAELEAELDLYPDQRGEILLEAAQYRHRAGNHARAIELLTEAIRTGGEDGGNARVALAEVLFDLGRDTDARTELDTLRHNRTESPVPYHMAAELLEERGDHQQALTWFNMAVSRLTDEDMAETGTEFGFLSYANNVLAGRRRIRRALGMPPDQLDETAQSLAEQIGDIAHASTSPLTAPRHARILFWPRDQFSNAHQNWPGLIEHTDFDTFATDRDKANRELTDSGIAHITMVPLTVAKLLEYTTRTGTDPRDSETRMACMHEIIEEGNTINWPPPRNSPCWCGSAAKYKKCCGRPINTE
ncbi:SEC-C metal-binding domain-containing protein [Nocardia arizonensis]|uniref:SEC-C metal-binding domain-containing protein n=1 Tax=Nocardia arizonensis TaxID=1141647 RepID=UPI0006D217C4|nr:tetratricopeptide repeat protein [Nocardia arizonensis]